MNQMRLCRGPCASEKSINCFRVIRGGTYAIWTCLTCEVAVQKAKRAAAKIMQPSIMPEAPHPGSGRLLKAGQVLPVSVIPPLLLVPRSTVLVLGDIHFPWHHKPALSRVVEVARELQPEYIVQVGDLYDQFGFSKYPRSVNLLGPAEEMNQARAYAEFMWKQLHAACPSSKLYQLWGNHDDRAHKRILERSPEHEHFVAKGMRDLYTFPGVNTLDTSKDELLLDNVVYMHGFRSAIGDHAKYNLKNTVVGHLHRAGLVTVHHIWELNVGWLGDVKAPVYSYKSQNKLHGTTLGVGLIDSFGPRFIPFY